MAALTYDWKAVKDHLPRINTPILLLVKGIIYEGELRWDIPGHEDDYKAYRYFINHDEDQEWEWNEITHWTDKPELPEGIYVINN